MSQVKSGSPKLTGIAPCPACSPAGGRADPPAATWREPPRRLGTAGSPRRCGGHRCCRPPGRRWPRSGIAHSSPVRPAVSRRDFKCSQSNRTSPYVSKPLKVQLSYVQRTNSRQILLCSEKCNKDTELLSARSFLTVVKICILSMVKELYTAAGIYLTQRITVPKHPFTFISA